tara:strand:+ start:183 stop:953 length:771 start_codon:yes stop_codon:yes gene_type:complete
MELVKYIKSKFSNQKKLKYRRKLEKIYASRHPHDLNKLAAIFRTDKFGNHSYTQHYQTHFSSFKDKKISLLEIGVGGYDNPIYGGHSLRMWKSYFKKGKIYSIDIFDKNKLQEPRIKIFQGSQIDIDFLNKVLEEIGELSIIIDDGSHVNDHVIQSFDLLFPKLKTGGIYVIEDTQTSYWPNYGGTSTVLNSQKSIMGYFKSLLDGLNHAEFLIPNYKPTYYDLNIVSMHFYHNMIFIYKGENNEKSNFLINNQNP